jgi:hypothetical protein
MKEMDLIFAVVLIPAISDISDNKEGTKREIDDAGIEAFCRLFAQLLGGFGANRTLGGKPDGDDREKQEENYEQTPLFHF